MSFLKEDARAAINRARQGLAHKFRRVARYGEGLTANAQEAIMKARRRIQYPIQRRIRKASGGRIFPSRDAKGRRILTPTPSPWTTPESIQRKIRERAAQTRVRIEARRAQRISERRKKEFYEDLQKEMDSLHKRSD